MRDDKDMTTTIQAPGLLRRKPEYGSFPHRGTAAASLDHGQRGSGGGDFWLYLRG